MAMDSQHNITVGKYLISPLTKLLANGWYACSVSIRSGSGSATHDRVLRLTRLFRSQVAAVAFATTEGLQWIGQGARANPIAPVASH
jgi:phage gp46-like protein